VICGVLHEKEISKQFQEMGINARGKIISEPFGRNTAPAILLAVLTILKKETDAIVCVFPADHVIRKQDRFNQEVAKAIELAGRGHIVTFGIKPSYPETGYGYIEAGTRVDGWGKKIRRFVEKPDRITAESYLRNGNFLWNSGMFAFRASVIVDEFKIYEPELLSQMKGVVEKRGEERNRIYFGMKSISIDYAVMEKTPKGVVLPSDFEWSDIGSWKSLYDFLDKDKDENVILGDVVIRNTKGCLILGGERLLAVNTVTNMAVIDTRDSLFISDLENSREVKTIFNQLQKEGRKEYREHSIESFLWGARTVLEAEKGHIVIRLDILPGKECLIRRRGIDRSVFTVIEGRAGMATEKKKHVRVKGDAHVVEGSSAIRIENRGVDRLRILEVSLIRRN
jgi:mannose-1-phosphate guanylyltransferase/mannose-6-phosphate isomerase